MLKSRLLGNILKKGFNSKYRRKEGSVKPQAQDFEKTNFREKNATLQSTTISAEEIAPDCVEKTHCKKRRTLFVKVAAQISTAQVSNVRRLFATPQLLKRVKRIFR